MLVARYLEVSLEMLSRDQEKFRNHMAQVFGPGPFSAVEVESYSRARLQCSLHLARARRSRRPAGGCPRPERAPPASRIEGLRRQVEELQQRLDQQREGQVARRAPQVFDIAAIGVVARSNNRRP
jgi:polyhydroxyalkanoate synthesis regulator protein